MSGPSGPVSIRADTADTAMRARAEAENFPVAGVLLPARYRAHLMRVYGFARRVDDIGDEATGDRNRLLDAVSEQLDKLFAGSEPDDGVIRDLAATVRACRLDRAPFDRLVEANRQDQIVSRYASFDQLVEYCALSANPVGELVLGVFDVDRPDRRAHSDRICTALQVLEHCQDVGEDYAAGRVYLPAEDLDRFDVAESELAGPRASTNLRALVGFQVQRAVAMLDAGRPLVDTLSGTARVAVAGYLAGGLVTARALAASGFDVLTDTPRPSKAAVAAEAAGLLGRRVMR